jgi:hypothetical protein
MIDWEAQEPGFAEGRKELPRLLRRSRSRRLLILFIACLVTSGMVAWKVLHPPKREAKLALRIVESDFDLTKSVRPIHNYTDYIWGVFLSGPRLQKIILAHKLYPKQYEKDPQMAIEAMRDDMDVEVWRNYFLEEHYEDDDEARSVRFSISWKTTDPQLALDVVRDLAQTVVLAQTEERREVFSMGQEDVRVEAEEAYERLAAVRTAEAQRRTALAGAGAAKKARLMVELADLEDEEKDQVLRLEGLTDTKSRIEITAAWEHERSGLVFEMVDPGYVEPLKSGPRQLVMSAVMVFVATLFFAAVVFGAFDKKIRQAGDVRHLGIPVLGAVPTFPGDDTGSLTDRLRAEDRLRWEQR